MEKSYNDIEYEKVIDKLNKRTTPKGSNIKKLLTQYI